MLQIPSITNVTSTAAQFNFAGGAPDGAIELQLAETSDFAFAIAPIFRVAQAGSYTAQGLNQRSTLYARGRNRRADGSTDGWGAITGFRTADGPAQGTTQGGIVVAPAGLVRPVPILALSSGSATLAGFALDNLLIDAPIAAEIQCADGAVTGCYIAFQTAGQPIDTFALLNTNLPEQTQIYVQAGPTLANATGGAPAFSTAPQSFRVSPNLGQRRGYHGMVSLPAPQAYPFWAVFIANTQLPGGLLYAEHLVAGLNLATKNMADGMTETGTDLGDFTRTRNGMPDQQAGLKMRQASFDLAMLTEQQYETMLRHLMFCQNQLMLMVPNSKQGPYLHDRLLYGRMTTNKAVRIGALRATRSFAIDSLI